MNSKGLSIGLIIIINLFFSSLRAEIQTLKAEGGTIDLTQVEWENQLFELQGEWDFYWKNFILPKSPDDTLPGFIKYVSVHPESWTKVKLNEQEKLPSGGFGTYRLRIKVPNETVVYGLKIRSIFSAYNLYVNGVYYDGLGSIGKTNKESKPQFLTKEIPVPVTKMNGVANQMLDLVIQVSNFHHRRAGTQQPVKMGRMSTVIDETQDTIILNLLLIGIILIIGLNHILMYVLRRLDVSNLIFGILSMVMVLRNITTGERIIMHWFPNLDWELLVRLDNFSGFGTITLFAFYFYILYKRDFPKTMFYIIMGIGVLITLLVFTTKAWFYGQFRMIFEIYIGLGGLYLVFGVLAVAAIRKRQGSFLTFLGMFLLYATAVNDVLSSMGLINSTYIAPYGIAAFMILQSYLHTRKSALALKENQKLSNELRQEKFKLEERINERTKELSIQAEELGKYRVVQEKQNWINDGLQDINEVMRQNKDNLEVLADGLLAALVKKVNAQLGVMYLITKVNDADCLKLLAHFGLTNESELAYLDVNEGLAGKCFNTGNEEELTDLPDKYFEISSGLGTSLPKVLALFPMKIDELVIGVIEIASFKELTEVHKEFLRKAIVNIAAQLNIVKLNTDNQRVLQEYKGYKTDLKKMQEEYRKLQEEFQELREKE